MNILNSMLGEVVWTWDKFFGEQSSTFATNVSTWLKPLMSALSTVLWIALALVGAAGGIYAVYVGIKMARADSAEAREENKKRFINILVSVVVVLVLIIFFNTFLPAILSAVVNLGEGDFDDKPAQGIPVRTVVNTVRCLIGR